MEKGNGDAGVNPRHLLETTLVDMVELGTGCAGDCVACGAFQEKYSAEERRVRPISPEQLEENISQEIVDGRTGTRYRLVDLFRRYMTTGVDMEPLESDIFNEAAELIYELSDEKSKLVAISHGLRCNEILDEEEKVTEWVSKPDQLTRLERLVQLMLDDKIPLFVLSMDSAREKGLVGREAKKCDRLLKELDDRNSPFMKRVRFQAQMQQREEGLDDSMWYETEEQWVERLAEVKKAILRSVQGKIQRGIGLSEKELVIKDYLKLKSDLREAVVEANARNYAVTVCALRPAIEAGKRVVFSLQGDKAGKSPVYVGITYEILQRMYNILQKEHGVTGEKLYELISQIDIQPPRFYTGSGRARNLLDIDEDRECTVIPDKKFVKGPFRADPFKINRGRVRSDGTLEIQLYRPKRTYNDTVDPKDNPWRAVDLEEQVFETVEIVKPENFLERLEFNAEPRFVATPSEQWVEDASGIYPLSRIDDDQFLKKLVEKVSLYFDSAGDDLDYCGEDLPVWLKNLRQHIIEALIPDAEVKSFGEEGESFEETRKKLADKIIEMHTPVLGEEDESRAGEMGKILAIQALLKELGVNIELWDEF